MPRRSPDDILIRITIDNRGPDAADLHVLPQLWARNTWDWRPGIPEPTLDLSDGGVTATHNRMPSSGGWIVDADAELGCSAATKPIRPCSMAGSRPGPFKDGINDYVVVKAETDAIDRSPRHQMRGAYQPDAAAGRAACHPAALAAGR